MILFISGILILILIFGSQFIEGFKGFIGKPAAFYHCLFADCQSGKTKACNRHERTTG